MASTNNTKNKRTGGKKKYQLVNVDVWLKLNATANQQYKFAAATTRFSQWLLDTSSGQYAGREVLVHITPKEKFGLCDYFFVKAERQDLAKHELTKIIKLFGAQNFTKTIVGPAQSSTQKWFNSIDKMQSITITYTKKEAC